MAERNGLGRLSRIEGPDGAGKSTQMQLAHEYAAAHNLPFVQVREPGGTELGNKLREILLHDRSFVLSPMAEALIFTADRRQLVDEKLVELLNDGFYVSSDRGFESTIAYQSAKGGVPKDDLMALSRLALPEWYIEPDGLALLDISPEEFEKRMRAKANTVEGHDKIESRKMDFFRDVHATYKDLGNLAYATVIDAELSPEEVFNFVRPVIFGPEHA